MEFFTASGPGGQHKNRVKTACRIRHIDSGAVAVATEHKSQSQNKEAAFRRVVETNRFKSWHKLETARRLLKYQSIEEMIEDLVDKQLGLHNLKLEIQDETGRWKEVDWNVLAETKEV